MRKAGILISALAFGAFGLFAQDELATYQTSMRAAAGANDAPSSPVGITRIVFPLRRPSMIASAGVHGAYG